MKKIERDVLLYTTSQKKKIFIFLIFSFIKKDFQFFEKVFFNLFFKESQKYERLLFLLIFLETISKFSILRELVILFKLVFTKRPFFKNSYLYNFMLKNYQNRITWYELSSNPYAVQILKNKYLDKIDWDFLSMNRSPEAIEL